MRQYNKRNLRDMTILGGWLFADLVVALMVILLAAQPAFPKPVPKTPTPTPSPTFIVSPTPTPVPRLDFQYKRFEFDNLDFIGILNNTPSAIAAVEQFINGRPELHKRIAGLVVVYNGALSDSEISTAQEIDRAVVNNVLKVMGRTEPLLKYASYYDPLFRLGPDHNVVIFDFYLFQQQ